MSDLAKRLRASVRMGAVGGNAHERGVCERQMIEAAVTLEAGLVEIIRLRAELAATEKDSTDCRAEIARLRSELAALRTATSWHQCKTHGDVDPAAWGCPECVRELRAELAAVRALMDTYNLGDV